MSQLMTRMCPNCKINFTTRATEPYIYSPGCRMEEKEQKLDEPTSRELERIARQHHQERLKIALTVYRDICSMERLRHVNSDAPEDFTAYAVEAVEAADALMEVLYRP